MGTNQEKIEKISISRAILLGFLRSLASAIPCEGDKATGGGRVTRWLARRQNVEGPVGRGGARAVSCSMR